MLAIARSGLQMSKIGSAEWAVQALKNGHKVCVKNGAKNAYFFLDENGMVEWSWRISRTESFPPMCVEQWLSLNRMSDVIYEHWLPRNELIKSKISMIKSEDSDMFKSEPVCLDEPCPKDGSRVHLFIYNEDKKIDIFTCWYSDGEGFYYRNDEVRLSIGVQKRNYKNTYWRY